MSTFKLELPEVDLKESGITIAEVLGISRAKERALDKVIGEAYEEEEELVSSLKRIVESDTVTNTNHLVYSIYQLAYSVHAAQCKIHKLKSAFPSSLLDLLTGPGAIAVNLSDLFKGAKKDVDSKAEADADRKEA